MTLFITFNFKHFVFGIFAQFLSAPFWFVKIVLKCPTWYSNLELTLLKALLLTLVNCSNQTNPKNQAFKTKWMKWPTLYQLQVSIMNAANVMWIRLILQLFVYICKDFTSYPWYSNVSSAKRLLYRTKLMKQNSRVWQYWLWSFKPCA